jgi:methyltransferase (TIGR00027 family)
MAAQAEDQGGHGGPLAMALRQHCGIAVTGLAELDSGVYRVRRPDGPDWVARVFGPDRARSGAEGDAEILRFVAGQGFPAERCATGAPVFALDAGSPEGGQPGPGSVLVTEFVTGGHPRGTAPLYYWLGETLGRLHQLPPGPGAASRPGGGWHHVTAGTPADELAAAAALLDPGALAGGKRRAVAALQRELERADGGAGLPEALSHPDFGPANVIAGAGGEPVLVDWTGAGRGPRLFPLAFLLWAAGMDHLSQAEAVAAGYATQVRLEPEELRRLPGLIRARPLVFDAWRVSAGRGRLAGMGDRLAANRELGEAIAARAREVMASPAAAARRARPGPAGPLGQPDETGRPGAESGQVGETGLTIAAIRAQESARPDRLFDDPLAAVFAAAGGRVPGQGDSPWGVRLRFWVVARTVFLDELLAEAAAAGGRQVVLLGAGYDARAFRLDWPPGTRCFELDTADVLDRKAAALASQQVTPRCELVAVPADLRTDWPGALLGAGLDPHQPTTWIAEGLLVYLKPEEVNGVLADLSTLSAPGSRLGLTMSRGAGGPSRAKRRSTAPDDPVAWLSAFGWLAEVTDAATLLRAYGRLPAAGAQRPAASSGAGGARGLLISATRAAAGQAWAESAKAGPGQRRTAGKGPARQAKDEQPSSGSGADEERDLPTLLSQALVAFTIEFDNEFEHQMPHRTTRGPAAGRGGPYLLSAAQWWNFLRLVTEAGIPVAELAAGASLSRDAVTAQLTRMSDWWGYVSAAPDPDDERAKPPRRDWLVRPTEAGHRARRIWAPLTGTIEQRWHDRFGASQTDQLSTALRAMAGSLAGERPGGWPWFLPVGGTGSLASGDAPHSAEDEADLPLPVLLSRVLLAFTLEFEHDSRLPLEISANALRVLRPGGIAVRDVQRQAGLAAEAISQQVKHLEARKYLRTGTDPDGGRAKMAWLTPAGERAQGAHRDLVAGVERRWRRRFGAQQDDALREALHSLLGQPGAGPGPLAEGLRPYPDGWRAHRPYQAQTDAMLADPARLLPRYPVISHRGGFPDGA